MSQKIDTQTKKNEKLKEKRVQLEQEIWLETR